MNKLTQDALACTFFFLVYCAPTNIFDITLNVLCMYTGSEFKLAKTELQGCDNKINDSYLGLKY